MALCCPNFPGRFCLLLCTIEMKFVLVCIWSRLKVLQYRGDYLKKKWLWALKFPFRFFEKWIGLALFKNSCLVPSRLSLAELKREEIKNVCMVVCSEMLLQSTALVFCFQNCSNLLWEKNCSIERGKLLKSEAEGREFAKFLRSLEQFIQTVKGQNNFW